MTIKIIIRERGDDYMAFIEGRPDVCGSGKGVAGAVGDLVLSHQETCGIKIDYERDYDRLKKDMLKTEQKIEQKEEPKTEQKDEERLKIGQEIICPKHGSQIIEVIDDSVPEDVLYILSCGCIHEIKKKEDNIPKIGRRKGPYSNW